MEKNLGSTGGGHEGKEKVPEESKKAIDTSPAEIIGGGGKRGKGKKRVTKESKKLIDTTGLVINSTEYAEKLAADDKQAKYVLKHPDLFPKVREVKFNPNRKGQIDFKKNPYYSSSAVLDSRGEILMDGYRCDNCGIDERNDNGTFAECVALSKDAAYPDLEKGKVPFNGSCNNCVWGAQGSLCTLREGGASVPPRKRPAPPTADEETGSRHYKTRSAKSSKSPAAPEIQPAQAAEDSQSAPEIQPAQASEDSQSEEDEPVIKKL